MNEYTIKIDGVIYVANEHLPHIDDYKQTLLEALLKQGHDGKTVIIENLGIEPSDDGHYVIDPETLQLGDAPVFFAGDVNELHPLLHEAADEGRIAGAVGLPEGVMGNSEVGHLNIGAGRVVYQDLTRINRAIEQGEFARNRALNKCFDRVGSAGGTLHVMGLLSPGGVHSQEEQIFALLKIAAERGLERVMLHAFLDGRDTPPRSALASLEKAAALMAELGNGHVASICGRYYAMDRDRRWDRVSRAYKLLVRGEAPFHATSAVAALEAAYSRDEGDEFVQPTAVHPESELPVRFADGDAVVFEVGTGSGYQAAVLAELVG